MSINRPELFEMMGVPKAQASKMLDLVLNSITEALAKGEDVTLIGFGTFKVTELAERTGYTKTDNRYYWAEAGVFLSVDPMADQRSWVSPYSYCQNSPVMRVDPTGALDDEWDLLPNGEVKHANNNGGETHHSLHAVDENGNRTGQSITVQNRNVLDQLTTTNKDGNRMSKGHSNGSIDDVFKVFFFGANNSNVEWGAARYGADGQNLYAVFTSQGERRIDGKLLNSLPNVLAFIHSHPRKDILTFDNEMNSMGAGYSDEYKKYIFGLTTGGPGDWRNVANGDYNAKYNYVYIKQTQNLYYISPYKISPMGKLSNYKSLYFGVLNHK